MPVDAGGWLVNLACARPGGVWSLEVYLCWDALMGMYVGWRGWCSVKAGALRSKGRCLR